MTVASKVYSGETEYQQTFDNFQIAETEYQQTFDNFQIAETDWNFVVYQLRLFLGMSFFRYASNCSLNKKSELVILALM